MFDFSVVYNIHFQYSFSMFQSDRWKVFLICIFFLCSESSSVSLPFSLFVSLLFDLLHVHVFYAQTHVASVGVLRSFPLCKCCGVSYLDCSFHDELLDVGIIL